MKGRVVILKASQASLEIDVPEIGLGAVQVRTTMAGICGSATYGKGHLQSRAPSFTA